MASLFEKKYKLPNFKRMIKLLPDIEEGSNCLRREVGAVLWDTSKGKVVAKGTNVTPAKSPCVVAHSCMKHTMGFCPVIHAEVNCILNLLHSRQKFKPENLIMIATYSPCFECSKMLQRNGIKIVYYLYKHHKTQWEYLKECGIQAIKLEGEFVQLYESLVKINEK